MSESLPFRLRHMFACACKEPAEAADRIEKLEAALRKCCEDWNSPIFETDWDALVELSGVYNERVRVARKALEGKDE